MALDKENIKIRFCWKVTFIFCLIATLATISGYFYLLSQAKSYTENNTFTNMRSQIFLGKEYLERYLKDRRSSVDFHTIAKGMQDSLAGVHVTIIKSDGKVFGDSELVRGEANMDNFLNRTELQDALYSGFGASRRFNPSLKKNMLSLAVPFGKEKIEGLLRFSVPLRDVELLHARLFAVSATIIVVILLLSFVFGFMVSVEISGSLKEIKSGKEYLNNIIDSVGSPLFVKDRRHRWVLLNDAYCEFMGYMRKDLIGKSDYDFFPRQDADTSWIKDEHVFSSGKPSINEEVITDASGLAHSIVTKKVLYKDNKGQEYIVGIMNDVTELKKLEAIRDDLMHMIVHDLNNPLTVLSTELQLLKSAEENFTAAQKEDLDIALIASNDLKRMVGNILDINKMEESKINLNRDTFILGDIARKAVEQMKNVAYYEGKRILLEAVDPMPPVSADKEIIMRVLANLISNALKFSSQNGSVIAKVFYKEDEAMVYAQIKNEGIGIPKDYLEKIFDKFVQVKIPRIKSGRGLGLTFCKMMIEAHGGKIWADSEGLDKGVVITFSLPALCYADATAA